MSRICAVCGGPERIKVEHSCPGATVVSGGQSPPAAARRYVITLTAENAAVLDGWLAHSMQIHPAGLPAGIPVTRIDAIKDKKGSR